MYVRVELSRTRLRNAFRPAKIREFDQISTDLRECIEGLCDGRLKWPLLLRGDVGSGKTCAALCLVDRVANAEFWPIGELVTFLDGVRRGRETWNNCGHGGLWTERTWWRHVEHMPLLALDDLGIWVEDTDKATPAEAEAVYRALDARDGKPVICTTNLEDKELEAYYNRRIRSRMCSGTTYELKTRDRRLD